MPGSTKWPSAPGTEKSTSAFSSVAERNAGSACLGARQVGEHDGGERRAEAEGDDVHLLRAGDLLDHVERLERPLAQVVLEAHVPERLVRVAVADAEDWWPWSSAHSAKLFAPDP